MSDEKFENEEIEETVEAVEEAVEEIEETEEIVEEAIEEIAEETAEGAQNVEEIAEAIQNAVYAVEKAGEGEAKSKKPVAIIAIIAVLVVAAVAIAGVLVVKNSNKYNRMGYINISGRTLDDVAADSGMSLEEFKAEFQLPEDMKGSTTESAAYYSIPAGKMAEMNGITFDQLKEMIGITDNTEITESTPWGQAEGEATLGAYVGEANLESFKEYYGLGDDITADTKWKEIRNIVDQKALEEREAQEAAEAEVAAEIEKAEQSAATEEAEAEASETEGEAEGTAAE